MTKFKNLLALILPFLFIIFGCFSYPRLVLIQPTSSGQNYLITEKNNIQVVFSPENWYLNVTNNNDFDIAISNSDVSLLIDIKGEKLSVSPQLQWEDYMNRHIEHTRDQYTSDQTLTGGQGSNYFQNKLNLLETFKGKGFKFGRIPQKSNIEGFLFLEKSRNTGGINNALKNDFSNNSQNTYTGNFIIKFTANETDIGMEIPFKSTWKTEGTDLFCLESLGGSNPVGYSPSEMPKDLREELIKLSESSSQ